MSRGRKRSAATLEIKQHEPVELHIPSFSVDNELHKRLRDVPIFKNMNKSFALAIIGRAGSGKTSIMTAMLATPKLFKKVFNKIYLFMPDNSRESMVGNIFEQLPEEQVFGRLNLETLTYVFEQIEQNAHEDKTSLLIFDDVQQYLKGESEALLTHMLNNRRHLRLSIIIVAQTFKKIPRSVRAAMTDFFLFHLSKSDFQVLFQEMINLPVGDWENILHLYRNTAKTVKFTFLYIHPSTQEYFINWDQIVVEDGRIEQST